MSAIDLSAFAFKTAETPLTVHDRCTFTFKRASGIDLPIDVFIPAFPATKEVLEQHGSYPVVFWIHGGGGVQGGRTERYQHLLEGINKVPCVGIFPDYRYVSPSSTNISTPDSRFRSLCPQVRLEAQLEDVADAFKWTIDSLPAELDKTRPSVKLDLNRIVCNGNSMGGTYSLALPLGLLPTLHISDEKAHPYLARFCGTVPIYPVINFDDEFWAKPRKTPFGGELPPGLDELIRPFTDPSGPVIHNTHPEGPATLPVFPRNVFYPWAQSQGCLYTLLFGPDKAEQNKWLKALNLYTHLATHASEIHRVVGSAAAGKDKHLHIFLTHGDSDLAVPVHQSRKFVELARSLDFEVEYEEHQEVDHLFDAKPDLKMDPVYAWVQRVVGLTSAQ